MQLQVFRTDDFCNDGLGYNSACHHVRRARPLLDGRQAFKTGSLNTPTSIARTLVLFNMPRRLLAATLTGWPSSTLPRLALFAAVNTWPPVVSEQQTWERAILSSVLRHRALGTHLDDPLSIIRPPQSVSPSSDCRRRGIPHYEADRLQSKYTEYILGHSASCLAATWPWRFRPSAGFTRWGRLGGAC